MSRRIASLHAEIGADTSKLDRALSDSRQDLTGFGDKFLDTFSKVSLGINQAVEVAQKLYQAGKAVYEFARGAAELEYSREKFDRLTVSIGATGDAMLGKLRMATRGLVSDAQLVQSAGDFISLGLAKTEDQVVRLTRVAGALGMDMNQLVLTLTNQTTMRFDALGVAVDGFDERLETLKATGMDVNAAFTEAFLQQAETQIGKVGEQADETIGSFMRLEAQWTNFIDGMRNTGITGDIVSVVADYLEAGNRLREAREDGIITDRQYGELLGIIQRQWADGAVVLDKLNAIEERHYFLLDASKGQMADYAAMQTTLTDNIEWTSDSTNLLIGDLIAVGNQYETVIQQSQGMQRHKEMWEMTRREIEKSKAAVKDYFADIDRGIGSQIEGMIKDIEFNMAGGGEIQNAAASISTSLSQGAITEPEAREYFAALYREAQELDVELGNITADEAAQNIADTLGISLTDAQESMDGIVSTMDIINGMEATARVRLELIDTQGVVAFLQKYGWLIDNPSWGTTPTGYRDSVRSDTFYSGGDNPEPN